MIGSLLDTVLRPIIPSHHINLKNLSHGTGSVRQVPVTTAKFKSVTLGGMQLVRNTSSVAICTNECKKARNGICEDGQILKPQGTSDTSKGRERISVDVFCDLGTDCKDCGTWNSLVPDIQPENTSLPGPLAVLLSEGVEVRVRKTKTPTAFKMAYANPSLDLDVSEVMERAGMVEGGITQIFHEVLKDQCILPNGKRALVLDVGANFGYFSVLSALYGCRVIAWEPVPLFQQYVRYNLLLNNVSHLVELRDRMLGDVDGQEQIMMVPTVGIWGTASVHGMNQFENQIPKEIKVQTERLDSVVVEDTLLLKVDVEGFEPFVFRGMKETFQRHSIENILMEYSPGIAERLYPGIDVLEETPLMLVKLLAMEYKLLQLPDNYGKSGSLFWTDPIPALPEVLMDNLKYDIHDTREIKAQRLGCPRNEALAKFEDWRDCNKLPEDFHPKSFRSMFSYNTNIWATSKTAKSRSLMKSDGPAGLFSLEQDASREWVSRSRPENGIGMRVCFYLEPKNLVRNRCSCASANRTNTSVLASCLSEESIVQKVGASGNLPYIS
ncbi:hypothetical protein CEUSTIGMA_g5305.t1 [Chlamydomonas eustigma]|uniref:Methyltransferase FkbM domain-containing protein n=1 Tax=Chlamydomonas eustigma TaxID=1157962 RepID=A0A250X454_9CHLO|nr:hypothetical protein CEUSTIGMA_g5305.t1 [Chlamydomonas eustigma]|eukprot:GAX77863.1 hypothetical protein CEUSTIGMA_g5305.t1 [Chlamydomonas eustigma]